MPPALYTQLPPSIDRQAGASRARCLARRGYLWSFPEDADDRTGLGGGITWQWDPELCDALIDKFDEDFFFIPFIKCSDLKASMHRAFASWSDNHKVPCLLG